MGTWAEGNFHNDSALDWLAETIYDPIVATIQECLPEHDEANGDYIMAAVETLAIVCEQLPVIPPEPEVVQEWRDAFLLSWHGYIDELDPTPEHKEKRLKVIEATFDRLFSVANAADHRAE